MTSQGRFIAGAQVSRWECLPRRAIAWSLASGKKSRYKREAPRHHGPGYNPDPASCSFSRHNLLLIPVFSSINEAMAAARVDDVPRRQSDEESGTFRIDEKVDQSTHVETADANGSNSISGLTLAEQKKTIRRIDIRLLPILGVMYSISLIDRTNLGLAMVAGLQQDLGLQIGNRYTIIVMVFFVAYILFEIPSVGATWSRLGHTQADETEPHPSPSGPSQLALLPRHRLRNCAHWHGIHKALGYNGSLQGSSGHARGWLLAWYVTLHGISWWVANMPRMHVPHHLLVHSLRSWQASLWILDSVCDLQWFLGHFRLRPGSLGRKRRP